MGLSGRNSMAHCCDARGNTDHCDSIKLPGYINCVPKVCDVDSSG